MSFGAAPKCPRCSQSVYVAEQVIGAGKTWHKRCFVCKSCKKGLDSSTLAEHEGEIYCKSCHSKAYGPKGFGYGIGAGVMSETTSSFDSQSKSAPAGAGPSTQIFGEAPTKSQTQNLARDPKYMGTDVCPRCDKKVYFAEKVIGAGVTWHKMCFACYQCRKGVESTTVCENNGQIFCKGCYAKNFGPKGFGYGVGAGALSHAT